MTAPAPAPATEQLEGDAGPSITRIEWAPVARVNLLPREIGENRRFRHVQQGLVAVVVLVVAAAGAAFWWSAQQVSEARDSLEVVQSRTLALQAKQRSFAEVPATTAKVEAAQTARATVMANDVPWYRYLTDLEAAAPADVSFTSLTLKVSGPSPSGQAAATPGTEAAANPFMPAGAVGDVAIQGISGTFPKVADWMDALDKVAGLEVSTLDSATGSSTDTEDNVTFSSGITITNEALSHRFDRKAS